MMAKVPVLGRVKTRLGRDIGAVAATQFYRSALRALAMRLARDPRWTTIVAIAPDRDVGSGALPGWLARTGQGVGDLGARMQRQMDRAQPGPVAIIGTDIPGISRADIARAFDRLGSNDAVFGPAPDGGYWLVGFRRSPRVPKPFGAVRWSSEHALGDTCTGFPAGQRIAMIDTLDDVDDGATFHVVRGWSGRVVQPWRRASPQ